jgi:hypothetical protein
MRHRWAARYSSSEMLYLGIVDGEVRLWLDHSPASAERYGFDDVLNGAIDGQVGTIFGAGVVSELKSAVREWVASPSQPFDKHADMLRRRREAGRES